MNFTTAREYADHLSTVIDDEDLVLIAVRRKFPDYGYSVPPQKKQSPRRKTGAASRIMGTEHFKEGGSKKPDKEGAWMADANDRIARARISDGSDKLLSALWLAHPVIMQQLGAVRP